MADAAQDSTKRILLLCPVKTKKDFTDEKIQEMERRYRPKERIIRTKLSVLEFGPYETCTIETIINHHPEWILWAVRNVRGFYVQDTIIGAAQRRLEEIYGKGKAAPRN